MRRTLAAMASGIALVSTSVLAATIDEIIVTTSPLGESLQPARVIGEQELLLRRASTIGETLDAELGISSSYFGPAASRPIIRGLGGSRVQVLTDAISTLDVADVSADHAVTVEPVLARSIEIIRGPATLLYGSQAAGGVVNVLEGRIPDSLPEDRLDGAFEVRGDTASGEEAVVGRIEAGIGPVALHLDGLSRETDDLEISGFPTADPAQRPDGERRGTLPNSASETDGLAGGLSWLFDNGFVGASVSTLDNTYGLPGPEEEEAGAEEEPARFPGPFIDLEQTRVDLRGEITGDGLLEKTRLSFGINSYEHVEIEPSGEPATRFDNDAWQGRLEFVHRELAGSRGAAGVQVDDRDFSAEGEEAFVEPVSTGSVGLFIVEQISFDRVRLELGLRADWLDHKPETLRDYDETAVSAAAGLTAALTDVTEVYANLARTERHPGAEELYSSGPHLATRQFEIGLLANPSGPASGADKEVSVNVDAGMRRSSARVQIELGLFYNDIDDYIYQALTGDVEDGLPVAIYRQADAEFWGIEAEARVVLADGQPLNPRLRVFTDFVEAELKDGSKLPRIPPLRFGGGVGVGGDAWGLDLDVVYHAEQDDISSYATDAYTMLKFGGWYRLQLRSAAVELFAKGTNLLDEEARKSTSFLAAFAPLPGASLQAGARVSF